MLEWAKLVEQFVAALAWPFACVLMAFWFRPQLRDLLSKVRKFHTAGLDFEVAEQLQIKTAEIRQEHYPDHPITGVPQLPNGKSQDGTATPSGLSLVAAEHDPEAIAVPEQMHRSLLDSLLTEAADAPKAIVIIMRQLVGTELRRLLAATGHYGRIGGQIRQISFAEMLKDARVNLLRPELVSSIEKFRALANGVIHGELEPTVTTEIVPAGLNIIDSLRSIPHQRNFVHNINVAIYSDPQCTIPAQGHGISLEGVSPSNERKLYIYPTTRTHFVKGKEVAWEWSRENQWKGTWYRDESGTIKQAWASSLEFVGRHLEDV